MIEHLYIHIPFCSSICGYCDFYKTAAFKEQTIHDYSQSLSRELILLKQYFNFGKKDCQLKTIFFGGGTPGLLGYQDLNLIFKTLHDVCDLRSDIEITLESNPELISNERIDHWKRLGINRISIGVQSLDEPTLKVLDRKHQPSQSREALNLLSKSAMNYNVDLIFGVPNQSMTTVEKDLCEILTYHPNHISPYILSLEDHVPFTKRVKKGLYHMPNDQITCDMYFQIADSLKKAGYKHYEVSNYARDTFECRHNQAIWHHDSYLALGTSACGYVHGKRYSNKRSLKDYLNLLSNGNLAFEEIETLSEYKDKEDWFITRLRNQKPFSFSEVQYIIGESQKGFLTDLLADWKSKGWIMTSHPGQDMYDNTVSAEIEITDLGFLFNDEMLFQCIELLEKSVTRV